MECLYTGSTLIQPSYDLLVGGCRLCSGNNMYLVETTEILKEITTFFETNF